MITKKLVQLLNTDAQLAFVLAHETGHIAAQHGRKAINQAMISQGLASILFGKAGKTVQTGVNVTYTLYNRGYTRDQEYQADTYGVNLMSKAGYNPEGGVEALAKLGLRTSKGINKYFATHPDTPDRIDRAGGLARADRRAGGALRQKRRDGLFEPLVARSDASRPTRGRAVPDVRPDARPLGAPGDAPPTCGARLLVEPAGHGQSWYWSRRARSSPGDRRSTPSPPSAAHEGNRLHR